jgi:PAS domain S-box-containing protein
MAKIEAYLTEKDELLRRIAELEAEVAEQRQELAQASARQWRETELVYKLSADLVAARELTTIYNRALDAVFDAMQADRVSLLLLDEDNVARFRAWRRLSDAYRVAVEGHFPWAPDERNAQPITVPDVYSDPSLDSYRPIFEQEGIRALAFIPLAYEGRLLGKFMTYFDTPHTFTDEELWLAQTVANHVAFALEHQRTDQAIQDSEAKFHAIFDKATSGIVLLGSDGAWLEVNPAICKMLGCKESDLLGKRPERFLPPDYEERSAAIAESFLRDGHWRGEFPLLRADGEIVHLDWRLSEFLQPGIVLAIATDITERKLHEKRVEAEHAVTRTLAEAHSLAEAAPTIIATVCDSLDAQIGELWLPDETNETLYCALTSGVEQDERWQQFAEESRKFHFSYGQSLVGRVWAMNRAIWISDLQGDPHFARTELAIEAGLYSSAAFPILNGGEFLGAIVFHSTRHRQPDHAFLEMMSAIGSEIGQFIQRWRAEDALRDSEAMKNLMLQSSQDCIKMLSADGALLWMNDGGQKLLEIYDIRQHIHSSWLRFWEGIDQIAAAQAIETAKAGGTGSFVGYSPTQTGTPKWWEVLITPIGKRGKPSNRLLAVSRDITERKHAEAERERLIHELAIERVQLEVRVRERTQQVRALAVELSLAEHQERKRVSQILHDHVQQMLYAVQMRSHLIELDVPAGSSVIIYEHLAEMKRLTEEAIKATRTLTVELNPPVLENEGLPEALAWLAYQMQEVHTLGVTIETQGDCRVDHKNLRVLIFQIIRELLFNVVKHAHTTEAAVLLQRQEDRLIITVTDHGEGFNASIRKAQTTHGFGLHSIRERLDLFDGRIELESQPGEGTKVILSLPLSIYIPEIAIAPKEIVT